MFLVWDVKVVLPIDIMALAQVFATQFIATCSDYVADDKNKTKINSLIISPTMNYIVSYLYPYLIGFSILFVFNFVLLISLLVIVSKIPKSHMTGQ